MKKILVLFLALFGLLLFSPAAKAQDVVKSHIPIVTNVSNGRFEFVQATHSYVITLLLDKHTGRVWSKESKGFKEILVEDISQVEPDKINFQLYLGNRGVADVYLLNIHTGEMWEYTSFKSKFKKINSPLN